VARPYGVETTKYDLLVLQQIPNKRQCWQTSGAAPVLVDPLLLNFDFTGICNRATDSNGYSVRIDGQDYGLDYLLRVVPKGNELALVATARTRQAPELLIGRTQGMAQGFMQIQLEPGWQLTKRTFNGKQLGHFYFSGSQASIGALRTAPEPVAPLPTQEPTIAPPPNPTLAPVEPGAELVFPNPNAGETVTPPPEKALPIPQTTPTPAPKPRSGFPSVNDFRQTY
jgi:hypothetical protein